MKSPRGLQAALLLGLTLALATSVKALTNMEMAELQDQALTSLSKHISDKMDPRVFRMLFSTSPRVFSRMLVTFAANEYSKCIYSGGDCTLNPLYLATSEFGVEPKNAVQKLMLGYAYQAKQCSGKNSDQAGCNALAYCTYQSATSLCQYNGDGADDDTSNLLPSCAGAKINLDAFTNYAVCPLILNEANCKSTGGCKWANSACSGDGDATALVEFFTYVTTGSGEFKDEWFGTCASGKLIKTIFTTCRGTDQSKCDTSKCNFATFCFYKAEAATTEILGDNEFTKKYVEASNACGTKTTRDTCEAEKGPAVTVDLSKYSDLAALEKEASDKGSAASVTYSAVLMAASALAGLLLFMAL